MYGEFAHYYDELMNDVDYKDWYCYIESILKKFNKDPKEILEMACGTGNFTYYLCKKGYKVTCFDVSSEMLSVAYNKLSKFKRIDILRQDMRNFNINKKFDVILSLCDSINYITNDDELLKTFKNVNKHLENDGIFIFDINSYYKLSEIIGDNIFVEDRNEIFYIWQNEFDKKNKLANFYLTFFIKTEQENYIRFDENHIERAYSIDEIKYLLKKANFKETFCYCDFTVSEPKKDSERIHFIALK